MQYHFLNKQGNDKLIIFFAGWSFDYKPFEFLDCGNFDVLMLYDYNDLTSLCADVHLINQKVGGQEGKRADWFKTQRSINAKKQSLLQKLFCMNSGNLDQNNCRLGIPAQHETNLSTSQPFNYSTDMNLAASKEYYLIAWSMGVFTAYLLKDELPEFSKKIAVNGTPHPVDDKLGIPLKPFLLTLRHAKAGLEGKFYQNIFEKPEEYKRYTQTPVERSIENRVTELNSLYEKIKNTDFTYKSYYDKAIISSHDKIIPPQNQLNFWKEKAKIIESGHFPFYNFKSWNEILCN